MDDSAKAVARSKFRSGQRRDRHTKHIPRAQRQEAREGRAKGPQGAQKQAEEEDEDEDSEEDNLPKGRSRFSRRVISSNEFRYAEPERVEDEDEADHHAQQHLREILERSSRTADIRAPIGGDNIWDDDKVVRDANIDWASIAQKLTSIPIYPHLNVDESLLADFPDIIRPQQPSSSSFTQHNIVPLLIPFSQPSPQPTSTRQPDTDKLLDELLSMDTPAPTPNHNHTNANTNTPPLPKAGDATNSSDQSKEDMEAWLDSVI